MTEEEKERDRRIKLSRWAYAYEIECDSLVSDAMFDQTAKESQPALAVGYHDDWWRENFVPYSGCWVHTHPDVEDLAEWYRDNR